MQVLLAVLCGILVGFFFPPFGTALKPLGDGFIKLVKMMITPIIFCTVVHGIASVADLKKLGRIGGKTLIYFETVSTVALIIGLVVVNVLKPGAGFNIDPQTLDADLSHTYTQTAQAVGTVDFLLNLIPNTFLGAFVSGDLLQVLLIAVLTALAISFMGERGKPLLQVIEYGSEMFFGVMRIVVKAAPVGAFGAMGFTVGSYGIGVLGHLLALMAGFYLTAAIFVIGVLGSIAWYSGFSIFRYLNYIKDEVVLVLGTSSSETALPGHDPKNAASRLCGLNGRAGHSYGVQLQSGRHQHLHGDGGRLPRPGHQHTARSAAADQSAVDCHDHLQRRQWCHGRGLRHVGGNPPGRAQYPHRVAGVTVGHRPFHERMPRHYEPDRQWRRDRLH